ncbi:N-acetyltransferase GCN5 [Planococcus antarcticus DSM 14505]|uniref:N-acetyltransferase GCN5 n=1 Tax=Planococcus antarcticus DSM 14505 TaxID=1185653 RepID=A0AA87IPY6_9BACL|nr:GNAT family N-acetyltransferase [Planococcus antarcticus]EIM08122.1 N-acetyltransferase GCN5 [Planococcus antarcticus DSM 14505]
MTHNDYEIIAQWLSEHEVLKFYGDVNFPFTLEQVQRKYEPRINGDVSVHPFIVELDKTPIGFLQCYKLTEETKETFGYPENQNVYGIDQFIGDPQYFNKGIGTVMITKFLNGPYLKSEVDVVTLDPDISNKRAIRCYEKCGFVKVKKVNEGASWLMALKTRGVVHEAAKSGNE